MRLKNQKRRDSADLSLRLIVGEDSLAFVVRNIRNIPFFDNSKPGDYLRLLYIILYEQIKDEYWDDVEGRIMRTEDVRL